MQTDKPIVSVEAGATVTVAQTGETWGGLVRWLAFAGGLLMLAVSMLVVANIAIRGLADASIDGTFDLVKIGTALGVFLCLPITQARRGNIMVDTFTTWLPRRVQLVLDTIWDVVYGAFIAIIGVAMLVGTRDQYRSNVQTTQLSVPLWPFNLMAAILLLLLAALCVATAFRLLQPLRGNTAPMPPS